MLTREGPSASGYATGLEAPKSASRPKQTCYFANLLRPRWQIKNIPDQLKVTHLLCQKKKIRLGSAPLAQGSQ